MVSLLLAIIYLSFISLGLPDSLLGAAWPSMYDFFGVPLSFAGIISMIISLGTIVSSLMCDRLSAKFSTHTLTTASIFLTALSLLGFSFAASFWQLCLLAVPYGLGAGCIDAALNNYVACHFSARHMSWLHCMWGVGTIIGPNIIAYTLSGGQGFSQGYRTVALMQIVLAMLVLFSAPLWRRKNQAHTADEDEALPTARKSLCEKLKIPGAAAVVLCFFCYCALEQTAMLWAGSYLKLANGLAEDTAAKLSSLFFIGITLGRFINGFICSRLGDTFMVRIGEGIILGGIIVLLCPLGTVGALVGISLLGLGCAPIYPSIIHSTPERFGKENSQSLIGLEMACAYVGTCLMPPLFGLIANSISIKLLPLYLLIFFALMLVMHEVLIKKRKMKSSRRLLIS